MSDEALIGIAHRSAIFARVSPEHKLRLVSALQARGEVTAMTGDGVNDAPALKKANIGIAMGIKGTEAAKEAAEMVLADDNFASIVHAVEEGRTVYDNLKKALQFTLPTNGGEALVIIASILFGWILPLSAVQVLWINMVTAVSLAMALVAEPMEAGTMQRPPRDSQEALVGLGLLGRIAFVSVLLCAATLSLFYVMLNGGASEALARTVAVNALVMGEVVYLFNSRTSGRALSLKGLRATPLTWAAVALVAVLQAIFTYLPFLQGIFGTAAMPLSAWGLVVLGGILIFLLVELEKWLVRGYRARRKA